MRYRSSDGLIRGKRGGISSRNTPEDWAIHHQIFRKKYEQDMEKRRRVAPKRYPKSLIHPYPDRESYTPSLSAYLYYYKRGNKLVLKNHWVNDEYYPKIGCPLILDIDNVEYCCEILNYNDKQIEMLICAKNEKLIYPIEYGSIFFGIVKSDTALVF